MIFQSGYRITQVFGNKLIINGEDYYTKFGFKNGHEGLDAIPKDINSSWEVMTVEEGMVVRDLDNLSNNYGRHVVILNPKTHRAWWYCHLKSNTVKIGDWVEKGQVIGVMGGTGLKETSFSPHLHLGLRMADDNGSPINTNNGYKGFVNPLPILQSFEGLPQNPPQEETMTIPENIRIDASNWQYLSKKYDISDPKQIDDKIKEYEITIGEINEKLVKSEAMAKAMEEQLRTQISVLTEKAANLEQQLAQNDQDTSLSSPNDQVLKEELNNCVKSRGIWKAKCEVLKSENDMFKKHWIYQIYKLLRK